MPQYFSPGVYVEEVDSGPRPIQGVSTSVTGAVGVTVRGPTSGKPELVTSFNEFVQKFGGFMPEPNPGTKSNWSDKAGDGGYWWLFPNAVKGFFDNGGQQLYVKRVLSKKAVASVASLGRGMHSEVTRDAAVGSRTLQLRHLIDIDTASAPLTIINAKTSKAIKATDESDTFTVKSYNATTNTVEFYEDFGEPVLADRGDFVDIHAVQPNPSLEFTARANGDWGDALQVRVQPVIGASLSLLFDESNDSDAVSTQIESVIQPFLAADYDGSSTTMTVSAEFASVIGEVIGGTGEIALVGPASQGAEPRRLLISYSNVSGTTITITPPSPVDEVQTITITGALTDGDFEIEFTKSDGSSATATVAFDATLGDIQSAIDTALGDAGQVTAGGTVDALTLTFGGSEYAGEQQPLVRLDTTNLAGATDAEVTETEQGDNGKFVAGSRIDDSTAPVQLWSIVVEDSGLAADDKVSILGRAYTLSPIGAPANKKFRVISGDPTGQPWQQGTAARKQRRANVPGSSTTIRVVGADRLYPNALVELENGAEKESFAVAGVAGNVVTLAGTTQHQYYENQLLRLVEASVAVRFKPGDQVEAEEEFSPLRLTTDDHPNALVNAVERRSSLVRVVNSGGQVTSFSNFPIIREGNVRWQSLAGGSDKPDRLSVDDFIGVDGGSGNRTGIQALEDIDDISLVVVPGVWSPVVRAALIQHCEAMKYRFAIFDPPPELSIEEIRTLRSPIDTKYGAIYYPWIRVRDPRISQNVAAPPSAHLAGLYARVDSERGFHKAPANEVLRGILPADPVRGIGGLLQDVSRREQDLLNPEGINAIRFFPGRGQRVWGARTVSSDSNFRYVNVRRIFNFIEASIDNGTQFVVFEPNDETLWARVRQTVKNFLNTQWRNGVLEGSAPEEAYYVECDRGVTMSQDDIENGRLIAEVGIAPVFPAEFVVFRVQKFTADSKLA